MKQSMKAYKNDKALLRLLDARQLGLKLIANVTFGYTAASFSGRMPSVEVHVVTWHFKSLVLNPKMSCVSNVITDQKVKTMLDAKNELQLTK